MLFARKARPTVLKRLRTAAWPRRSFRRSFRYYRHRVLRIEASPHAIAAGVAAGAFASCTPLVGFHFILSFALAWMIGGSLIAAAFGTAVGNPLTFPFIWLSSFQLGELVIGESSEAVSPLHLELSFDLIRGSFASLWPTLKPMIVGGTLLGLVLAGGSYIIVRSAVLMSQSLRSARLKAALEKVSSARKAEALAEAEIVRDVVGTDPAKRRAG